VLFKRSIFAFLFIEIRYQTTIYGQNVELPYTFWSVDQWYVHDTENGKWLQVLLAMAGKVKWWQFS